jgi:serine protease Do
MGRNQEPQMPVKTKGFLLGAAAGAVLTGAVAAGATAGYQARDDQPRAPFGVEQPELIRAQNLTPSLVRPPAGAPLSFADIIERVSPAVVSLEVEGQAPRAAAGGRGLPPQLEEFFGLVPRGGQGAPGGQQGDDEDGAPATQRTQASGSGFFISADGYIVTNNHVVENARKITVHLSDERELEARVVGRDEDTDLAVLKVEGRNFPFVQFATNAQPRVGDWVIAIGNPFQLNGTATAGIVSAKGRDIGDTAFVEYLQIDAPINRGNSGGPTFDLNGRVVGVNTAIYSTTGSSAGVGFAIPADTADQIARQLISGRRITRGYLGAQVGSVNREVAESQGLRDARGALISSVVPNGPAARAGLQSGDIVLSVNGRAVADANELTRTVAGTGVGETLRLEIVRGEARRTINVTAGTRPTQQELAALDGSGTPGARGSASPAQPQGPAVLGMNLAPAPAGSTGLRVERVESNSDAAERGIQRGDLISRINDREVRSVGDVQAAVEAARRLNRPSVLAWITRGGQTAPVPIRIQPRAAG